MAEEVEREEEGGLADCVETEDVLTYHVCVSAGQKEAERQFSIAAMSSLWLRRARSSLGSPGKTLGWAGMALVGVSLPVISV